MCCLLSTFHVSLQIVANMCVSHPISFLNSSLGFVGENTTRKLLSISLDLFFKVLLFPACLSFILFAESVKMEKNYKQSVINGLSWHQSLPISSWLFHLQKHWMIRRPTIVPKRPAQLSIMGSAIEMCFFTDKCDISHFCSLIIPP